MCPSLFPLRRKVSRYFAHSTKKLVNKIERRQENSSRTITNAPRCIRYPQICEKLRWIPEGEAFSTISEVAKHSIDEHIWEIFYRLRRAVTDDEDGKKLLFHHLLVSSRMANCGCSLIFVVKNCHEVHVKWIYSTFRSPKYYYIRQRRQPRSCLTFRLHEEVRNLLENCIGLRSHV